MLINQNFFSVFLSAVDVCATFFLLSSVTSMQFCQWIFKKKKTDTVRNTWSQKWRYLRMNHDHFKPFCIKFIDVCLYCVHKTLHLSLIVSEFFFSLSLCVCPFNGPSFSCLIQQFVLGCRSKFNDLQPNINSFRYHSTEMNEMLVSTKNKELTRVEK